MGILETWPATARSTLNAAHTQRLLASSSASSGSTDPQLLTSNRKYLVQITQEQQIPTINADGSPIVIVGQVPQSLQMDQASMWKAPWGAGIAGEGQISDLLAVTMGSRLLAQVQTIQVWQGSSGDVDFTLTMDFRAWEDVDRDVMIPLQNLSALALPSVDPSTGWLRSPGPILDYDAVTKIAQGLVSFASNATSSAENEYKKATDNGAGMFAGAYAAVKALSKVTGQSLASAKDEIEALLKNKIEVRIGDWFRMKNAIIKNVQHNMNPQLPGPDGGLMSATVTVTFAPMFALTTSDVLNLIQTSNARLQNSGQQGAIVQKSPFGTTFGA